ncbi:kremen protein 2 [Gastrophryne carolinensis]
MLLLLLGLCVRAAPPLPEESECFTVNGRDYRGNTDRAGPEGIPCLYWNQTHQHHYSSRTDPTGELGLGDHNHCRNPDSDVQPWCYVSETEEGVYWKYCDIPSCHMPGYLGCFLDPGSPPGLTGPSGTSAKLTVQTCIQFCRSHGFQYAGLEAGYACFCGGQEDAAVLQEGGASRCDQMCFGRPSELCGGDGALSVYAVWVGSCGGNLSSSGVLYSPNYPDEYGAGRTCTWEIRSPGSVAVEMKFPSFHVEDPGDVLEVSDGQSGMPLMVIRGGQDVPSALSFPTAHLRITFISNQARGGAGFVLLYTGECWRGRSRLRSALHR